MPFKFLTFLTFSNGKHSCQKNDPKKGGQDPENFVSFYLFNISPILSTCFVGMPFKFLTFLTMGSKFPLSALRNQLFLSISASFFLFPFVLSLLSLFLFLSFFLFFSLSLSLLCLCLYISLSISLSLYFFLSLSLFLSLSFFPSIPSWPLSLFFFSLSLSLYKLFSNPPPNPPPFKKQQKLGH